jgi:pimeloyl-ACP methyl ester carboxylesterase
MNNSATPSITVAAGGTGRRIAADVTGPDDAPVVVLCHIAPGSRHFDPDPAATSAAGVRLIAVDRPGYGGSEPLVDGELPTITGAADDVATVLDHLGIRSAVVVGWSAGGRVAAALAARRPDLAQALFIVATPAPDEVVPWVSDDQRSAIAAMRVDPIDSIRSLADMLENAVREPAEALGMVTAGAPDTAAIDDTHLRSRLVAMLAEGFRQGAIGLAADMISYTAVPWGFDPTTISTPTRCVYGGEDALVPLPHGDWWARQIGGAELDCIAGCGHLVIRAAWPFVLTAATA